MLERSAEAPGSVDRSDIEEAIRRFTLDLEPDIVCWQELPNQVPFVETLDLMQATTQSHSGRLATLIAKDSSASQREPTVKAIDGVGLLSTFPELDGRPAFSVGNVHLEPWQKRCWAPARTVGNLGGAKPDGTAVDRRRYQYASRRCRIRYASGISRAQAAPTHMELQEESVPIQRAWVHRVLHPSVRESGNRARLDDRAR